MVKEDLRDFERQYNCRVLFLAPFGSKLYGTNTKFSDEDFKGVFIQHPVELVLKQDIDHYTYSSGDKHKKNDSGDVDVQLYSLQKFFDLLVKGETGALDLLFAGVNGKGLYVDPEFERLVIKRYEDFLSKKLNAFVGYCIGQSKKYGLKGKRYKELEHFSKRVEQMTGEKLGDYFEEFEKMDYEYIFMTTAPGPRTAGRKEIEYISVLGKLFSGDVTVRYFQEKVEGMKEQFGHRTKAASEGVDFKALSHAVRVISEVEELLTNHKITFPLLNAKYVKSVKEGKRDLDSVMTFLETKLEKVSELMEKTDLPEMVNKERLKEKILDFYESIYFI